ncbi:MAG: GAF domain-containing protein [Chloroflexi bacterium]|nr:GAF domain-containing protein [Chloroflexota bacterium]
MLGEQLELNGALKRLEEAGIDTAALETPLRAAVDAGDTGPLATWAYKQGSAAALAASKVQPAIDSVLLVSEVLRELPGACKEGAGAPLASTLAGAVVEGYLAVSSARMEETSNEYLRDRVAELTALHRVNSAANSSLKLNDMLNETAQAVVAVTRADICSIFIYEPEWDQLLLTATSGLNQEAVGKVRLQMDEGITGAAAMIGKPIAAKDAWADPRFKYVPALEEDKALSILAVPVVLFTMEKLVGVITIHTFEERDFSDNEIKFLETVAGEIAIAIENARLYEQTDARMRQKVAELSTLQGVSAHIAATLNLSEVLALIAHQAAHLVHADAAAIYELHHDAGILELVAQYNLQDPTHAVHSARARPRITLNVEQSTIAQAFMRGIPVPLPSNADAQLGLPAASEGYKSVFCVPLVAPRGIMGGICLYSKDDKTFSDEQVRLLDAFAHEAAIALENSRLYDAALRGLRAKSAMLQEMNHRVRNNLQTVAGLLSMQLRRINPDSEAATAVRESIARIQSMAAVHDLMMSGDVEVGSTTIYELARRVTEAAVSTLSNPGFNLKIFIDPVQAEQIRVGSHEATLLALLFNELISNAILHGFAGLEQGEIQVRAWLADRKNGTELSGAALTKPAARVMVEIADNGVGLPVGFDSQKDAHLGLNIVSTLVVSDLRGEFKIVQGEMGVGTVASFGFISSGTT